MKKSIKNQIISTNLIIVIAALIVFSLIINISIRILLRQVTSLEMRDDRNLIVEQIKRNVSEVTEESFPNIREMVAINLRANNTPIGSRFEIFLEDRIGNIKILNQKNQLDEMALRKIKNQISNENYNKLIRINIESESFFAVIMKINLTGSNIRNSWIVQYKSAELTDRYMSSLRKITLILLAISCLVVGVLGYRRGRKIIDPLEKIKKKANIIAKGGKYESLNINTQDEIGELALSIDIMADKLKENDKKEKEFLQNISHELKTPLTSIQGYAEAIKDGIYEDSTEPLGIIIVESERLKKLVEEIIYLSKLENRDDFYNCSKINIKDIIGKSIQKIKGIALKENINIEIDIENDFIINFDEEKLIRALINIISNCIKYADSKVFIKGELDDDVFVLEVFDDGPGFSKKDLKYALNRFYKGEKGGTGLGLSIAKRIIEKSGGSILIYNKEGYGGCYKIILKDNINRH